MRRLLWLLPVLIIVYLLFPKNGDTDTIVAKKHQAYWEEKHEFFKNSKDSPFVQRGVPYKEVPVFPYNQSLRVKATLKRFEKRELLQLSNSDGTFTNYLKFATATFTLRDTAQSLLILKPLGFSQGYLTAFGDKTSGLFTYGGGRYVDLYIGKSDLIEIDFNKSYNPYCAYFEDTTCPLPPIDNLLSVMIDGGEKINLFN